MPLIHYTEEQTERLITLNSDICPYAIGQYAHWVVDGGIEEEWDAYIEQMKVMGLDELIQIHRDAYEAYLESMK